MASLLPLAVLAATVSGVPLQAETPSAAAAVGYNVNTFSADFNRSNVDLSASGKPGFQWYLWNLFGYHANPAAVVLNTDQSVTLLGDKINPDSEIMTATPAHNAARFVGTAFGGGAYIEAEFKFNPDDVAWAAYMKSSGWPSFWALPIESCIFRSDHWPKQPPGYVHAVEVDFFEYLYFHMGEGPRHAYGGSMHDWYGIPNVTCPHGSCEEPMRSDEPKRFANKDIDFKRYHRFGFLWVPAKPGKPGYARFLLDGKPMGSDRAWTQYTDQPPTPHNQPWLFGVLDQQHLILILGTGPNQPMTIRSVNVWQSSAAQNLHQ